MIKQVFYFLENILNLPAFAKNNVEPQLWTAKLDYYYKFASVSKARHRKLTYIELNTDAVDWLTIHLILFDKREENNANASTVLVGSVT